MYSPSKNVLCRSLLNLFNAHMRDNGKTCPRVRLPSVLPNQPTRVARAVVPLQTPPRSGPARGGFCPSGHASAPRGPGAGGPGGCCNNRPAAHPPRSPDPPPASGPRGLRPPLACVRLVWPPLPPACACARCVWPPSPPRARRHREARGGRWPTRAGCWR